jgi:hypothetical protein
MRPERQIAGKPLLKKIHSLKKKPEKTFRLFLCIRDKGVGKRASRNRASLFSDLA